MQNQFLDLPSSVQTPSFTAPEIQSEEVIVTEQDACEDIIAEEAQTQAVTTLLAATQRKIRRRKIKFWSAFAVCEGTIILIMFPLIAVLHNSDMALSLMRVCLLVSIVALVCMLYTMQSPTDFDHEELTRAGGVRAIPSLIDSLSSGRTPSSRKGIYNVLTHLLPQMQATDANLLTARRRRMLNFLLKLESRPKWWSMEHIELSFTLAILKAYEQVGDPKAVPVVRKLANMRARTPRQRTIKQAAAECLPLLQSHTVPLDQNQTLLRAAGQSKAAAEVLLRPAAEAGNVPAEELLRAETSENPQGRE